MPKTFIISLGGSLIVPDQVNVQFLKKFRQFIVTRIASGNKFIIVCGGGKQARWYQQELEKVTRPSKDELDWIGIYATRFNAQLVRLMFGKLAHSIVVEDPNKKTNFKKKILIAGGWMPGRSTDDDAVRLAKQYGARAIINLSNIDRVYTKDPRKFTDATPIDSISWEKFKKIVGTTWNPGANVPFDPTAAKFAEKNKLRVIIANGKNLKNLGNILEEKKFIGTIIG